jgi:hypothetical protein
MRLLIIACFPVFVCVSCVSTKQVYTGNIHQQDIGKSKNDILRTYGAPDRIISDGRSGEMLIYEKVTEVTQSRFNSATYGESSSSGYGVYGNGVYAGRVYSRAGIITRGNALTEKYNSKVFLNLFVDNKGIVYDFKTNQGSQYKYTDCLNKPLSLFVVIYYGIVFPPSLAISLPKYFKLKKYYPICN